MDIHQHALAVAIEYGYRYTRKFSLTDNPYLNYLPTTRNEITYQYQRLGIILNGRMRYGS